MEKKNDNQYNIRYNVNEEVDGKYATCWEDEDEYQYYDDGSEIEEEEDYNGEQESIMV